MNDQFAPAPSIVRHGIFDLQVCVPDAWTDDQVLAFAQAQSPTENGWAIRREGDPFLAGDPERCPCHRHDGFVHIVVDPA